MFINGIRFSSTISGHIKFMTAEQIANAEASTLQETIRQVKQFYTQQGFNIASIFMDGKFACIRGNLMELQINLNICSNYKHVREIERLNCTVKEQVRGIYNTLTLKNFPAG